jgi:hypothetical protein
MTKDYEQLCRGHWEACLSHRDLRVRLASARGLLNLDPLHERAEATLRQHGDPEDVERLERLQRRTQRPRLGC